MQLLGKLGQAGGLKWRGCRKQRYEGWVDETRRRLFVIDEELRRGVRSGALRKLRARHRRGFWLVRCRHVNLGQGQAESVTVLWFPSNVWWGIWFCSWPLAFTVMSEVHFSIYRPKGQWLFQPKEWEDSSWLLMQAVPCQMSTCLCQNVGKKYYLYVQI